MSVWGNIYENRTDTTGRIMRAVEKTANGMHDASRWTDEDNGPGNALQGLEREVIDILVDTRLSGYQELGAKCAELENKLDEVTSRAERAEAALNAKVLAWANAEAAEIWNRSLEEAAMSAESFECSCSTKCKYDHDVVAEEIAKRIRRLKKKGCTP